MFKLFLILSLFPIPSVFAAEQVMYKLKKEQTQDEVYKLMGAPTKESPLDICKGPVKKGFMWTFVQPAGRIKEVNVIFCNKRVDMIEYIHKY